ncbi:MAG: bifunctional 5,10-methylenetetrahydrofolate dehydrogenase/5,10-methenyltetrahydrofolate cyclohydrolase [Candidatus Thermoplasmatota archaeon]|nr:bifunctional 5,10-methylenetetrahydrofolate dehydrogenase/5,10-methenyltetrahydrofolate cyclohydrolase [Candidatus Thermoplasmatota archaeon]
MELLKGKPVADRIDEELKIISSGMEPLKLVVYLVGTDASSEVYSRSKVKKGERVGVEVVLRRFPKGAAQDEIEVQLNKDSNDPEVHGIMIERPLPEGIRINDLMRRVPPSKDVEGLHPENYGLLGMGKPRFIPPTPLGALLLILHYGLKPDGMDVVIIGRSLNVGKPLAALLSRKAPWGNATVTLAHTGTQDLLRHTRGADMLITAAGRPGLIKGNMIKEGAVLVDLGITPTDKGIVGDIDLGSVQDVAKAATPTPGGTGPVTVSSMFLNLFRARIMAGPLDIGFTDELIGTVYQNREAIRW